MSFGPSKSLLIAQIGLSACFLIGATLVFYLKASLYKETFGSRSWKIHLGILGIIIIIVGLLKPYSSNIDFWNDYVVWFIYSVWGGYLMWSGSIMRNTLTKVFRSVSGSTTFDRWLVFIYLGNLLVFLAYIIGYFWLYLVDMLTFTIVFYAIMSFFLYSGTRDVIFQKTTEKYRSRKISPAEAHSLINSLAFLMEKEQLYKNPDLRLEEVSSRMGISYHKLSQLLNDNLGQSFTSYINQRRVEKAIDLLKENDLFTLEAIGYESGFVSKSGFYAAFKRVTGKTPASFRK
ncbi:MAG: helix-turn-helix domain-containing protein [Flavobacteriaceae bacterium]